MNSGGTGGTVFEPLQQATMGLDGDLRLTRSERRLLETLSDSPGRVFSRKELMVLCLGYDALVLERTIDVHICALRRKLGEQGSSIETIRAKGYRWKDESES
jgi:two-component system phosphate regulon response regulator PhoB